VWKAENAAVGFDVLTTCQPSTVWCSERLPAAAAQPAKVRQSSSATGKKKLQKAFILLCEGLIWTHVMTILVPDIFQVFLFTLFSQASLTSLEKLIVREVAKA
jgi:hypothetical protein